jgi:hypothetical protein
MCHSCSNQRRAMTTGESEAWCCCRRISCSRPSGRRGISSGCKRGPRGWPPQVDSRGGASLRRR